MLVSELNNNWGEGPLSQSHLFNRHIESLRPLDINVFLRSHAGTTKHHEAQREIMHLIDLTRRAALVGELKEVPEFTNFDPIPRHRITIDELRLWLAETTLARRRAILFGLETQMPVQDIVGLTWKKLRTMQDVPESAMELANSALRHYRLDYVFWEPLPNLAAAPLFGLAETIVEITQGLSYNAVQQLYREAIPIDTEVDLHTFMHEFCLAFDGSADK